MKCNKQNFFSFWTIFRPIQNFEKWEKTLRYHNFTHVHHIWYMVPEIWSTTDRFFVILGHLPHEKPKNSKSWKTKTSTCSVIFYTFLPKFTRHDFLSFWIIFCLVHYWCQKLKFWKIVKKLAILSFYTCVP